MTTHEEQNYRDLRSVVEEVNKVMAGSVSFVYLPGDNADQGKAAQYEAVREALDRLKLPWFAIVGDRDVHLKSLDNFRHFMMPEPVYSFDAGEYRFLPLNAFASANPREFDISNEQLLWLAQRLETVRWKQIRCIVLLHCYPSDLAHSADALRELLHKYNVLLVDMGHTHYNEIAHDGHCLYTATRSTGQIAEGPVGFSITNLDHGVVSWRFKRLGEWPFAMITTPAEERLIVDPSSANQVLRRNIPVRNGMNNLPAGLISGAAVAHAHVPRAIAHAVLIGVDLGPNLSVTGSLGAILWLIALRREEVEITAWQFLKVGSVAMPVALLASVLAMMK